jgi:rhodanese-related sulfurtransferase
MPKTLALLAALLLTACSGTDAPAAPQGESAAEAPARTGARSNIDVTELKAALDGGSVRLLIDVRTEGEYRGGHVATAVNIPLSDLDRRTGELGGADAGVVHIICQSGGRSSAAADKLMSAGFTVVNVAGGTGKWKAAGYPVE